jgi:hypothetical protein
MKTLLNITLEKDGKPILEATTQEPITTVGCIKAVLDNTTYENRGEQREADKVYEKVSALESPSDFVLENAEYEVVKRYIEKYPPFLTGRVFSPILAQFEE